MNEPSLDPPNGPDVGDPCAECGEPIDEHFEVEIPGPRLLGAIYVCSPRCQEEYLQGYADYLIDEHDWD
jgi:hypothetical protein